MEHKVLFDIFMKCFIVNREQYGQTSHTWLLILLLIFGSWKRIFLFDIVILCHMIGTLSIYVNEIIYRFTFQCYMFVISSSGTKVITPLQYLWKMFFNQFYLYISKEFWKIMAIWIRWLKNTSNIYNVILIFCLEVCFICKLFHWRKTFFCLETLLTMNKESN